MAPHPANLSILHHTRVDISEREQAVGKLGLHPPSRVHHGVHARHNPCPSIRYSLGPSTVRRYLSPPLNAARLGLPKVLQREISPTLHSFPPRDTYRKSRYAGDWVWPFCLLSTWVISGVNLDANLICQIGEKIMTEVATQVFLNIGSAILGDDSKSGVRPAERTL